MYPKEFEFNSVTLVIIKMDIKFEGYLQMSGVEGQSKKLSLLFEIFNFKKFKYAF